MIPRHLITTWLVLLIAPFCTGMSARSLASNWGHVEEAFDTGSMVSLQQGIDSLRNLVQENDPASLVAYARALARFGKYTEAKPYFLKAQSLLMKNGQCVGACADVREDIEALPDEIEKALGLPPQTLFDRPGHRVIHFIQSTNNSRAHEREVCAFESCASNDAADLVVIWSNGLKMDDLWLPTEKLRIVPYNFTIMFRHTPLERWWRNFTAEGFVTNNLSNALRVAVVYKFGGIYLDTDVWCLRSLRALRNTLGAELNECRDPGAEIDAGPDCKVDTYIPYNYSLCNAVLIFDQGHPFLWAVMQDFMANYNGTKWAHNGPWCVNRVWAKWHDESPGNRSLLGDFYNPVEIQIRQAFYQIGWKNLGALFDSANAERGFQLMQETSVLEPYTLHIWNSASRIADIHPGSVAAEIMAQKCPYMWNRSHAWAFIEFWRATAASELGKWKIVQNAIATTIRIEPKNVKALALAALAEYSLNNMEQCRNFTEQLIRTKPMDYMTADFLRTELGRTRN